MVSKYEHAIVRDKKRLQKIEDALWTLEIGLDCILCDSVAGAESEEAGAEAENLLEEATRLRRRVIRILCGRPSGGPYLG